MELIPGTTFRKLLRNELKERSQKNASYSLRAFAKHLGISSSGLSKVISGKMPISLSYIEKIGAKLKLSEDEVQKHQIILLAEKKNLKTLEKEFDIIEQDQFAVIKEWYHYALLNLMRTKDFKPNTNSVSKKLGISISDVHDAIDRLKSVGLLKIENGLWIDTSNLFTSHTNNKKFSEASKQNQIQLFEMATKSIESVDFQYRNHTGVTLAFSLDDLDEVKDFITNFRKEFAMRFDRRSAADEVYHLSIALFPLTKKS